MTATTRPDPAADAADLARRGTTTARLGEEDSPLLLVSVASEGGDTLYRQLEVALARLRELSSRDRVRALGRDQGYRLEDAAAFAVGLPRAGDEAPVALWLQRRLARTTPLAFVVREGPITLAAALSSRVGSAPTRTRYGHGADERLRVEAFELHVAEHCNLKCANCCNMSPLVERRFLSLAEVEATCQRMSGVLVADVLKIMGGEPLLHPDIVGVLRILRASGIGDRVRLFTNGLLLKSMREAFWETLDDLTISNYVSAPVKPAVLELAREKSRQYGFVLNIKSVDEFSQVLSPRFEVDDEKTRGTYSRCWLRHRCLIVRDGHFYMCTRSAYASDFLRAVAHDPVPDGTVLDRSGDGIPIDAPDLLDRLESYMNREEPLGACRYCHGGDGAMEPHYQLTPLEVSRGVLSRALTLTGSGPA